MNKCIFIFSDSFQNIIQNQKSQLEVKDRRIAVYRPIQSNDFKIPHNQKTKSEKKYDTVLYHAVKLVKLGKLVLSVSKQLKIPRESLHH